MNMPPDGANDIFAGSFRIVCKKHNPARFLCTMHANLRNGGAGRPNRYPPHSADSSRAFSRLLLVLLLFLLSAAFDVRARRLLRHIRIGETLVLSKMHLAFGFIINALDVFAVQENDQQPDEG